MKGEGLSVTGEDPEVCGDLEGRQRDRWEEKEVGETSTVVGGNNVGSR